MMNEKPFELRLCREGTGGMRFPLTTQRIRLGRAAYCDLSLNDPSIALEHAVIYAARERWWLRPEAHAKVELAGTVLDGESELTEGMTFQVGPWSIAFHMSLALPLSLQDPSKGETKLLEPMRDESTAGPFILRWTDRDGLPCELKIKSDRILIGKSKLCDVVLDDDYVSSRHAEICFDGQCFELRDMNSTNGTRVNGLRVTQLKLSDGSDIVCGKTKLLFLKRERPRRHAEPSYAWSVPLLGESAPFDHLAQHIERIAPLPQNVFIQGETGTGKELVAAALHELSSQKEGPFMALNCGAISKELMESELFGHEKGAFTGAQQRRAGAFELASGGTLFLDEIGELPLDLQPKLLRVLETGRFRRLGGREELKVNVRVFSATHRDLLGAIRMGRFREDLYYRLYILPIDVPPLRERLEDIPLLVKFFVRQACPPEREVEVNSDVFPLLKTHSWPGNIRELRNMVYRALAFCEDAVLGREHFASLFETTYSGEASPVSHTPTSLSPIKAKERETIIEILKACQGNQSEAAKKLGIGRTTLYYRLKEYGIDLRRQISL